MRPSLGREAAVAVDAVVAVDTVVDSEEVVEETQAMAATAAPGTGVAVAMAGAVAEDMVVDVEVEADTETEGTGLEEMVDTVVDPDTEAREATEVAREVMEDRADTEVVREEAMAATKEADCLLQENTVLKNKLTTFPTIPIKILTFDVFTTTCLLAPLIS